MLSNELIDWLYGVIASPVQTLRNISEAKPVRFAIALIVILSLIPVLVDNDYMTQDVFPGMGVWQDKLITFFMGLLFTALFLGSTHLLARLFAPEGTLAGFISAYGFSRFPGILQFPLMLMGTTALLARISLILSWGVSIWLLVLNIIALRENYQMRTGGAIFLAIGAGIASAFLLIIVGIIFGLGLAIVPGL